MMATYVKMAPLDCNGAGEFLSPSDVVASVML